MSVALAIQNHAPSLSTWARQRKPASAPASVPPRGTITLESSGHGNAFAAGLTHSIVHSPDMALRMAVIAKTIMSVVG